MSGGRRLAHDRQPATLTGEPGVGELAGHGVLAELAELGPFFTLDCHPVGTPLGGPWRPLDELWQPDVLAARVAAVRAALAAVPALAALPARQAGAGRRLGEVELRVAVSMAQLGLAGRLICPALGLAALTGRLLDPVGVRWRAGPDAGPVALSISADALPLVTGPAPAFDPTGPAGLADALAATVLAGPVRALVEASRAFGVSRQVLWGNVASVVNGAGALIGAADPSLRAAADVLVTGLLNQPPLRGAHQVAAPAFRRRSCCLVYRLAATQAPVCGDCVLDRAPAPARGQQADQRR